MLRLAVSSWFMLGMVSIACFVIGCGGSTPPADGEGNAPIAADGSENTTPPDNSQELGTSGDTTPPAVKIARDKEPGSDLIPDAEGKLVETMEGTVIVKKLLDGSVVDEYDGKTYPR